MNKQVLKFGQKVIVLAAIAGTLSFSAIAADKASEKETVSVVQYVGATDNGIVFNVKYDNAASAPFNLIIKNEFGDVVYQQQFTDKNFDKKVMLTKEPGAARLTFIIKSSSANIKQSFDITTTSKIVEEVVVKNTSK